MRENGFTLVELLGVIVVLTLLILLVFPSIINNIKSSSKDTDKVVKELIYDASYMYISDNEINFPKINGNKYIITLEALIENDLLKAPIKLSNGEDDITDKMCVQVMYNDGFEYELVETCEENNVICSSDNTNLSIGSKYKCQVNETSNYTFYLLSKNNKSGEIITNTTSDKEVASVNLIMEANIYANGKPIKEGIFTKDSPETVEWINESDYYKLSGQIDENIYSNYTCSDCTSYGPVTSMNYLYKATSSWDYVPNISMNYIDEGNGYTGIITNLNKTEILSKNVTVTASYSGLKARLPMLLEVEPLCPIDESIKRGICIDNTWLWNYLQNPKDTSVTGPYIEKALQKTEQTYVSGMYGYRLLNSYNQKYQNSNPNISFDNGVVDFGGTLSHTNISSAGMPDGIRPVITIPVENLNKK